MKLTFKVYDYDGDIYRQYHTYNIRKDVNANEIVKIVEDYVEPYFDTGWRGRSYNFIQKVVVTVKNKKTKKRTILFQEERDSERIWNVDCLLRWSVDGMKDIKLSEIKQICRKARGICSQCELRNELPFSQAHCKIVGPILSYSQKPLYAWDLEEENDETK